MRAAILAPDHTFGVADLPEPAPRTGELVLRVRACGICGSDLKAHKTMPAGAVLGHEFCGEVVAIGADVAGRWRAGELVASLPLETCGHCRWCLADEPAHCEHADLIGGSGSAGAFAEYVRVAADMTVRLGDDIGDLGALVEPLAVGLHTVAAGDVRPGDRVLIIGGGNIGAAVSVWARRLGAGAVVVSDPAPTRRDAAALFGATDVHDPQYEPPPPGFDVVFECVGGPGMVQAAVDAAAVHGRVVVAGVCMVPDQLVPITALMKEVQVRFAVYYRRSEFAASAALLQAGGVDAKAFVSREVGLDGVNSAFEMLLTTTNERKVLVKP